MGPILAGVLQLYLLVLIARIVFDYVFLFARSWQPTGVVLVLVEFIFTLTDPPLKALRRIIPPVRLGQFSFDLAFLVLFIGINVLIAFVSRIP